jgi:hypothetical protein
MLYCADKRRGFGGVIWKLDGGVITELAMERAYSQK